MATIQAQFYQAFWTNLFTKKIDLNGDTFRMVLHNTAPNLATNDGYSDLAGEVSAGGGYSNGGFTVSLSTSLVGGLPRISLVSASLTTSGSVGPYRYASIYSDTSAGDLLVCMFDYGSSSTASTGNVITIDAFDMWQLAN